MMVEQLNNIRAARAGKRMGTLEQGAARENAFVAMLEKVPAEQRAEVLRELITLANLHTVPIIDDEEPEPPAAALLAA
jgi:hypothetical protein